VEPTALLIDFGGTLDADGVPWADRFFAGYRQAGGRVDRTTFGSAFARSDADLAELPGITGFDYSTTVAAQGHLLAGLLPDGGCLRKARVMLDFVAAARATAARNREVLLALSPVFRLAVVSNYQGNLQPCLDELGLGDIFEIASDSAVIGARKPDRKIFDLTLARLGCEPEASWMIGDSPPNDIAAAAALGMRTCWVAPESRADIGVAPTARATGLDQLPGILAACMV
jgi:putative hydrolase of the HAD superfamily